MALRIKKLEYVFPTDANDRADGVRFDFAAITLYIPELTSRTFLSVYTEITSTDDAAAGTAVTMTAFTIGVKLGAAAFNDTSRNPVCTALNNGRNWIIQRDHTAYFTASFGSGASQTCQVGVILYGFLRTNTTAKIVIIYQFDDTSQTTRIKTVKIPLDSAILTTLTTTVAELGTNQVPLLDTFLPETTKVYRQIAFEITSNEAWPAGGASSALSVQLDAGTATTQHSMLRPAATGGGRFTTFHFLPTVTTSAVHAFKVAAVGLTGTFIWPSAILIVTYEYDHSASTRILNSLEMVVGSDSGVLDGTTATDQTRMQLSFDVEEPGTITLLQSGVRVRSYSYGSDNGMTVSCGSQTERTYTGYLLLNANAFDFIVRVDSGSPLGAGLTLARGTNTIVCNVRRTNAVTPGIMGLDAVLLLNYSSDKATAGADAHNHSIALLVSSNSGNSQLVTGLSVTFLIPETQYRTIAIGYHVSGMPLQDAVSSSTIVCQAEVESTEAEQGGWRFLGVMNYNIGYQYGTLNSRSLSIGSQFARWVGDADPLRLDPGTARLFRMTVKLPACFSSVVSYTYHALTFVVSGNVTGYTGTGSGITVNIHRTDTGEKVATTTTLTGGSYTATIYDSTVNVYAEAIQDSTHLGRSAEGLAA